MSGTVLGSEMISTVSGTVLDMIYTVSGTVLEMIYGVWDTSRDDIQCLGHFKR